MPKFLCVQRSLPTSSTEQASPAEMQEMYAKFGAWREQFVVPGEDGLRSEWLPVEGAVLRAEAARLPVDLEEGFTVEQSWRNGWPTGVRLDARDGGTVVAWGERDDLWISEAFVLIEIGGDDLQPAPSSTLTDIVEPLWNGEYVMELDRNADGSIDTVLLSQSEVDSLYIGTDADGRWVSIVMLGYDEPWRSYGFEGVAPREVREREDQLRACLAGERDVDSAGRCVRDG